MKGTGYKDNNNEDNDIKTNDNEDNNNEDNNNKDSNNEENDNKDNNNEDKNKQTVPSKNLYKEWDKINNTYFLQLILFGSYMLYFVLV